MFNVKKFKWTFLLTLSCFAGFGVPHAWAQKVSGKYPKIERVSGTAYLQVDNEKESPLATSIVVKEKVKIRTLKNSEVKVTLEENKYLVVRGNSVVSLPIVRPEKSEVPLVELVTGEIYVSQKSSVQNTAFISKFNEFITPSGRYILGMSPSKALSWVKVLEGSLEYSVLNHESSVKVKAGEKVEFQGEKEGSKIVFDVLLHGRKIPHGKFSKVLPLSEEDLKLYDPELEKKSLVQAQQKKHEKIKAQALAQAKLICENPGGEFNHCMWVLEGGHCYRSRCNANGIWAEKVQVPVVKSGTQCSKVPHVAPCDY